MAALSANDQGALLDLLLGFLLVVIALHAGETIVWALRLRRWDIASVTAVSCVSVGVCIGWLLVHRWQHGVHLSDLLFALGAQLALVVCVPARCLRRRVIQWQRYESRLGTPGGRIAPPSLLAHRPPPVRLRLPRRNR